MTDADVLIPDHILQEEFELTDFMRETMFSSIGKNVPKFDTFCKKLLEVPNEKRFHSAYDFFKSIDAFPKIERKPMKSSEEALRLKNLGNAAFGRGQMIDALKFYTKSVAVAPASSPDLAVAYGNRSAALFELQRYEACIVDINRALNESCPEASRAKLLNRKQKCLSTIIEPSATGDHQTSKGKTSVERKGNKVKKNCPVDEDALDLDYTRKCPIPKAKLTNKSIPIASDKVKIAVNPTFGRHIVAVKDMEIGEILSVEKAYTSVLFSQHRYSHCAYCFLRCEALIPCPDCSSVMYCSRRCREEDFNRAHRIECQIFFYSHCLGLSLPSSFRLWIQTMMVVTKQGENLTKLMKDPLSKDPFKPASGIISEKSCSQNAVHRILSLLNSETLLTYLHDSSTSSEEVMIVYYRPFLMSYILGQTTYFDAAMVEKAEVDKDLAEERRYVGTFFYKLQCSLSNHSLGIEELLQEKFTNIIMQSDNTNTVGRGFYLFHSFFNHSCNCNVVGSQHKDTFISWTTQPIKAGQQLCISYGPRYLSNPRFERQDHLRGAYDFVCRCVACEEDWPLLDDVPSFPSGGFNASVMWRYSPRIVEFYDNPFGIIEYSTDSFDLFRKFLRVSHGKRDHLFKDYVYALLMFEALLRAQGNNYVFTRDEVLMSL